jgi:hypothetical protein
MHAMKKELSKEYCNAIFQTEICGEYLKILHLLFPLFNNTGG